MKFKQQVLQILTSKELITSVVCTAVFAGIVSCGNSNPISDVLGGGLGQNARKIFTAGTSRMKVLPRNSQPVYAAAIWQQAQTTTVQQSFAPECDVNLSFVPAGSFVPVPVRGGACNGSFSQPQPSFPTGFTKRIIDTGTVSTLTVVIDGTASNGSKVQLYNGATDTGIGCVIQGSRCDDRTHTFQAADNSFIQAYLIPAAGDNITHIEVYFVKQ